MSLSKKNAYNTQKRIPNSVISTLISCDYMFFITTYRKMTITERINHKGYLFEVVQNRIKKSPYSNM